MLEKIERNIQIYQPLISLDHRVLQSKVRSVMRTTELRHY
jgi:hypothetical protein